MRALLVVIIVRIKGVFLLHKIRWGFYHPLYAIFFIQENELEDLENERLHNRQWIYGICKRWLSVICQ